MGQSIAITIAKGFAILHDPDGPHTINEDYRRILSVATIPMQSRAMLQSKGKSVFRHGFNHRGRCTIETAKIACFYVSQSGQNPTFILQSMAIVAGLQDCRIVEWCWKIANNCVLNLFEILQNSYAIAMGFSGCNDMPSRKILG